MMRNGDRQFRRTLLNRFLRIRNSILATRVQIMRARAYEQGLAAYKAGRYREALASLRPHARRGNALAQLTLGNMYRAGLGGVARDVGKAARWYHKAAAQGDPDAQFSLAIMYLSGDRVSENKIEAMSWLEKAAAQGHRHAQSVYQYVLNEKYRSFLRTSSLKKIANLQ